MAKYPDTAARTATSFHIPPRSATHPLPQAPRKWRARQRSSPARPAASAWRWRCGARGQAEAADRAPRRCSSPPGARCAARPASLSPSATPSRAQEELAAWGYSLTLLDLNGPALAAAVSARRAITLCRLLFAATAGPSNAACPDLASTSPCPCALLSHILLPCAQCVASLASTACMPQGAGPLTMCLSTNIKFAHFLYITMLCHILYNIKFPYRRPRWQPRARQC